MPKNLPGAATVKETRELLGKLSQESYYKIANSGELKTFKIGSKRYSSHLAIAEFIARREQVEAEERAKLIARREQAEAEERASAARSESTPAA